LVNFAVAHVAPNIFFGQFGSVGEVKHDRYRLIVHAQKFRK
jgi:hypothetical protein